MVITLVIRKSTASGVQRTNKLFRRLSTALQRIPERPSPETVHQLRTTIRRLETLLKTQRGNDPRGKAKLLKHLARLRRRAGRVRDVDVQLDALRSLRIEGRRRELSLVRRKLAKSREKRERKLQALLEEERSKDLARRLQRAREDLLSGAGSRGQDFVRTALRKFHRLAQQQPEFNEKNLHKFRVQCKHLRYLAEMAGETPQAHSAIADLKRIQDSIGEWHDWVALAETADQAIADPASPLLSALRTQRRMRWIDALRTTAEAKQKLIALSGGTAVGTKRFQAHAEHPPALLRSSAAVA
jgi:CHAD domain-containing protein